jgi:nitrogen regulatory protein P-II 1
MRLVIALIQPTKLKAVQEALAKIGVERMTVCDALGYGRQWGEADELESAAGMKLPAKTKPAATTKPGGPKLLRKVALEISVNEDFLDRTVQTIARVARTGEAGAIGDGKIFVLPLEEVVRLSDTVRGPEAVS